MADGPDPTERKGAEGIHPELGAPRERQGRRAGAESGVSEEKRGQEACLTWAVCFFE